MAGCRVLVNVRFWDRLERMEANPPLTCGRFVRPKSVRRRCRGVTEVYADIPAESSTDNSRSSYCRGVSLFQTTCTLATESSTSGATPDTRHSY